MWRVDALMFLNWKKRETDGVGIFLTYGFESRADLEIEGR